MSRKSPRPGVGHRIVDVGPDAIHPLVDEVDGGAVVRVTGEPPRETPVVAAGGPARAIGATAVTTVKIPRDTLTAGRLRGLASEVSDRPSEPGRVLSATEALAAAPGRFERDPLIVVRGCLREGAMLTLAEEPGEVGGREIPAEEGA